MSTIINIVSGKGGTGKTLFTAVLSEMLGNAGAKVLAVDLDIFVRGLTTLLYFQKNELLRITRSEELVVSDFFKGVECGADVRESIAICRYRSFDVLPSVARVDEIVNFRDMVPNSIEDAHEILSRLLSNISQQYDYDYIFLDSRAGYDELIAATHMISDLSICVEEDDNISIVTSDNLIAQLKSDSSTPVFRIRNKVRQNSINDFSQGISFLGAIPFDADVMNSFGSYNFWPVIARSIYSEALCDVWNNLAQKMDYHITLKSRRVSPIGSKRIERRLSMLSVTKRIFFIYGIIFVILGWMLTMEGARFLNTIMNDPVRVMGIGVCVIGLLLVLISVTYRKNN